MGFSPASDGFEHKWLCNGYIVRERAIRAKIWRLNLLTNKMGSDIFEVD
jgi:hypothetical protein